MTTKTAAPLSEIPSALLEALSYHPAAVAALFSVLRESSVRQIELCEREKALTERLLKESSETQREAQKDVAEAQLEAQKESFEAQLEAQKDLAEAQLEAQKRLLKMEIEKQELEIKLKETTKRLTWFEERKNILGALEWIGDKADTSREEEEAAFPMDGALCQLYATEPFQTKFLASLKKNGLFDTEVERSFVNLYHEASKYFHDGFHGVAVISQKDWCYTEQFALAALFRYHGISFVFKDTAGNKMESVPFDLTDIPESPVLDRLLNP
jgi:hypothetical protein